MEASADEANGQVERTGSVVFRRPGRMLVLDLILGFLWLLNLSQNEGVLRALWTVGLAILIVQALGARLRWRIEVGSEGIAQVQWRTRRWAWDQIAEVRTAERAFDLVVVPVGERPRRLWAFERVRDAADAGFAETVTRHAEAHGVRTAPLPFSLRIWPIDRWQLSRLAS